MKDVKDFDDVRWDDGKPTVTDYVWGRDNQTASLIRAYKDEIERLRKENEELHTIIDNLRGIFFNGAYVAESRVAKLKIAHAALREKE